MLLSTWDDSAAVFSYNVSKLAECDHVANWKALLVSPLHVGTHASMLCNFFYTGGRNRWNISWWRFIRVSYLGCITSLFTTSQASHHYRFLRSNPQKERCSYHCISSSRYPYHHHYIVCLWIKLCLFFCYDYNFLYISSQDCSSITLGSLNCCTRKHLKYFVSVLVFFFN